MQVALLRKFVHVGASANVWHTEDDINWEMRLSSKDENEGGFVYRSTEENVVG